MKIVADDRIPFINEYFAPYGELILKNGRAISHEDVKDADILIIRSITRVDKQLLANTQVKFVGSVTAGADHLDTQWLKEAGITFSVALGFNAPPVADYVLSVVAALQKNECLVNKNVKAAIIGVGNVGRLVVDKLRCLNFEVSLCDPVRAQKEQDFFSTPIDELADLDFISIHVPLTMNGNFPTYHFIDKHFLQRQKPGCILLNASRGAVIQSEQLIDYGQHLHWCFDVWEHEPYIDKRIVDQAVIATPHIAGYSLQSKIRGIEMIYRIACEKKIIELQPLSPMVIPHQQLSFSGGPYHWQEIVLGIFNPLIVTDVMRHHLLTRQDKEVAFDEMRNQFNFRHEFQYTRIAASQVFAEDVAVLKQLGLRL